MKVTDIEVHEISVDYIELVDYVVSHYDGPARRFVYVAHTDTGLEGLGEGHIRASEEVLDRYIGSNPFDWMGDDTSLALGTAMYDLMGKAAGVPCYRLFGQKYRSWVPVASWTVSAHPNHMADAVKTYAAMGYNWLKFHLSPFENVFAQTEAMQAVAPAGFKVHYDFTGGGTGDHMPGLLERLARYPIAGCFEDPLDDGDFAGAKELRRQVRLPILRHRAPLRNTFEVLMGAVDGCIEGHGQIADAIRLAGLCAAGNIPFSLQHVGGAITQAKNLHLMAASPSGFQHCGTGAEIYNSDPVAKRFAPINGFVRIPEEPGLGVELDREELERLKALRLPDQPRWIIRSRFVNGTRLFDKPHGKRHYMNRPDWTRGGLPLSYDGEISTRYWDDDGSDEFAKMWRRLDVEHPVVEAP